MKKTGNLALFMLIFILVFSGIAAAENYLRLIKVRGVVDTSQIGGSQLHVYSLWDSSLGALVGEDGSFVTIISASCPQKLSVVDDLGSTRALAIVLPEDPGKISFDAKSTAIAVLFRDPGLFRTSGRVKTFLKKMADSKSFQELTILFKKNLPFEPLEKLIRNQECVSLLEKCNEEIFGEDQALIRKSMQKAENKLQGLL